MSEISIRLENLTKKYGSQIAVDNNNIEVEKGELFGFLGPNGAGKTTTIKMITGLLEPTSGTAEINGLDVWKVPLEAKKVIAYVPDQPSLYPKLTAWDYLEFIGSVFQVPRDEFQSRATKLLATFDLTDRADDLMESYSHGMKQKAAICGALIHEPDVLFLDEPTVGLDPKSARNLKNLLTELCAKGMTVFMTTHILEIAEEMCDRIGIIAKGEIIALGTMNELRTLDGRSEGSLEDIFLELTGGDDHEAVIKEMTEEDLRNGDPK